MSRMILVVGLACFLAVVAGSQVLSQDFGQLLEAVDKLEASLKKMVAHESNQRTQQFDQLQRQIDAINIDGSVVGDPLKFQKELAELTALSQKLAQSGSVSAATNSQLAQLIDDIEFLKVENQYLRALMEENSQHLAYFEANGKKQSDTHSAKTKRPVGPKYNNLRFKDDYSYLNNSSNRGSDLFDPLKRISLGGNSHLSFGGHYRFRYESDNNRKLGASSPTSQEAYLNRLFLFWDLSISNHFRLFTEFKYAGITNNNLPAPTLAHDRPDLENLFVDGWFLNNKKTGIGLRVGRQELQFGKQRLISPLNWANTRRTFDGVRILSRFSGWTIDAFLTRPVNVDPKEFNQLDEARLFSGIYSTRKLKGNIFSAYFLVYTKNDPPSLAANLSSDYEYLTLGGGYDGKGGRFDWSSEVAYQFGSLGDKSVAAYMVTLSGGYSYKSHPIKPRIGVVWDLASGDGDPNDDKVNTFHQQFPLGHAHLGWADQVGRRNINSISLQLSAHPSKIVTTKLNWFSFNLMEKEDALYNAGGKASRLDITGNSGRHVGNEIDALVILKINRHASFHLGYLHFEPGSFIANTGSSESHNMVYMMLPVTF